MISPRILFEGNPTEAMKYVGVAKEFGRSTFAAGILSKVWRLGEDVHIRVMNNLQARVCKVWIEAGEPTKQFVARLMASVYNKLLYQRIQLKTETSVEPYWRETRYKKTLDLAGFSPSSSDFNDEIGNIGDLDWQNDNDVVTWFNLGKYHIYRYDMPRINLKNTYLYRKGKRSKSCPEKIVGACINMQLGKRYLAATVVRDEETSVDTLSVWYVERFKTDEWTLLTQLPPFESGMRLFTSVFFNRAGNEAIAVVDRYTSPSDVSKRLKITITKDEENQILTASYVIENPYPDGVETREDLDEVSTTTIDGTSLIWCDYYHIKNRILDEPDHIVDLVLTLSGTSIIDIDAVYGEDEGNDYCMQTGVNYDTDISGSFKVIADENILMSFPVLETEVGGYTYDDVNSVFNGSVTLTRECYLITNADLRGLTLFFRYTDYTLVTTVLNNVSEGKIVEYATLGTETFRCFKAEDLLSDPVVVYENINTLDDTLWSNDFYPFNRYLVRSVPFYPPYSASYSLNTYDSMFTWYNWNYLTGQIKTLLSKADISVFVSYMYYEYISHLDEEKTFYMYYLTDGDPKTLAGIPYDTFFHLSIF